VVKFWASVLGGYPRGRLARYTMRDLDSGALEPYRGLVELERASALVVGAQLASGMRFVVDGMLDWHDIFRPFAEAWRNVYLDGIIRYFDNNFFYRIPVFRGEPEPQRLVLPGRVKGLKMLAEPAGVKVVVPGPLTMVRMGRNESGLSDYELVDKVASALALEVRDAVANGAAFVQIDEPFLSDPEASRDDARIAAEAASRIAGEAGAATTALAVYFDSPKPGVYEEIIDSRVSLISLDLSDAPARAIELLREKGCGGHGLVLGVIDARRIHDDRYSNVKDLVAKAIDACRELEEVGLTTTTWLDLIPLRFSLRKTYILGLYTERLAADVGGEAVIPISAKPEPYLTG